MKKYFLATIVLLIAGIAAWNFFYKARSAERKTPLVGKTAEEIKEKESIKKPMAIILSAHFDDAVLSLGGLLAKKQNEAEVDTFFAGKSEKTFFTKWDRISGFKNSGEAIDSRNKENIAALSRFGASVKNYDYLDFQYREKGQYRQIENGMEKEIESVMAKYFSRQVFLYGPAEFGAKITHPDHKILHEAFVAAAKKNKNPNVKFLIYEDFPYVWQFNQSNKIELKKYLESNDKVKLKEEYIDIGQSELEIKIKSIKDYISQVAAFRAQGSDIADLAEKFSRARCKASHPDWYACEAVYEIVN